jgi:hypothetical protein
MDVDEKDDDSSTNDDTTGFVFNNGTLWARMRIIQFIPRYAQKGTIATILPHKVISSPFDKVKNNKKQVMDALGIKVTPKKKYYDKKKNKF